MPQREDPDGERPNVESPTVEQPTGIPGMGSGPVRGSSDSALDELFIVGAKYHEPSAAERAATAKRAALTAKANEKQRQKDIRHTRGVLEGHGHARQSAAPTVPYDKRVALIAIGVIGAIAVVLSQTPFGH